MLSTILDESIPFFLSDRRYTHFFGQQPRSGFYPYVLETRHLCRLLCEHD